MKEYTSHTSTNDAIEEIQRNPRSGPIEIQLVGQYEIGDREDGLTNELKQGLTDAWGTEIKRDIAGAGRRVLSTTIVGEELIRTLSAARELLEDFFEKNGWIHIENNI